ncbi:hypothetical protein [Paenibacillus polymyxa]|uniref:hypothetical protein n=1 Tax=Paenibacillus polymyxa TaxID=1406 RepID=UPI0008C03625|nr:hypothetical protein [Paenibacillus polymyxa]SEJ39644.1 hypothetical protein SAMN04488600_102562 [Paenibacillus polymyxa]
MIQLEFYSENFENEYWKVVKKIIDKYTQDQLIESCKNYLPTSFFIGNKNEWFKQLILAPFEKLRQAEEHITNHSNKAMKKECFYQPAKDRSPLKKVYKTIHDSYTTLAKSQKMYTSMRVRIVNNSRLTVCPYCNRDYINCRGKDVSGAQLDHFFSKSDFPLFSVCLYNLVPVCGNCNRVKSAKSMAFASPFDNRIEWEEDITFSYRGTTLKDIEIVIESKGNLGNNMKAMKIESAYQIHSIEILELLDKKQMYSSSQQQEFKKVLSNLTEPEIKKIIFGPKITKECMRTKPLGKMMHDLHKELKIYT